jgi:type IV pilus assembly protein PilM
MDFLRNIFSIFSKKGNSVLGIDIGSSAIKIVQIKKRRGKAVLETYGELALGPYSGMEVGRATSLTNEKTVEALRDILREAKTTTIDAGIALPLSSSLVSFITVPEVPERQMQDVISLEARKYIPVPMSEVVVDYSPIPKEEAYATDDGDQQKPAEKKTKDYLVVAIHNEYINNYQTISNGSGVRPSFYEIELFSSIRSVVEQGVQAVMIIDMGCENYKIIYS